MLTLYDLIERQAKEHPRTTALVFKGQVRSYAELQDDIDRWASVLAARGVKAGDRFGLVLRNSPEFVITFFASGAFGRACGPGQLSAEGRRNFLHL